MSANRQTFTDLDTMGDGRDIEDTDDHDEERCTHCEAVIDVTRWHPLLSRIEDGAVELYPFCSVACRDAWRED